MEQFKAMEGKTIETVRELTPEEIEAMGWYYTGGAVPLVAVFTDGTYMVPMSDPEGNQPGALYVDGMDGK